MNFQLLDGNNLKIRAAIEGEGPLVVLVHGWPESFYSWRHQINTFSKLGYTVIAPDIRGYGDSEKPTNVFDYSMKKITAELKIEYLDLLELESCSRKYQGNYLYYQKLSIYSY